FWPNNVATGPRVEGPPTDRQAAAPPDAATGKSDFGSCSPKGTAVTEKNRNGAVASTEALCTESPDLAANDAPTGMSGVVTVSATPSTVMAWREVAAFAVAAATARVDSAACAADIAPIGAARAAARTIADRLREARGMDVSSVGVRKGLCECCCNRSAVR